MTTLLVTNVRTTDNLALNLDVAALRQQDSGSRVAASVEFDLADPDNAFELLPEDEITIRDIDADPGDDPIFGGFARSVKNGIVAIGRSYHVTAYDYSTLLDRINVVQDDRDPGESDHDRLVYLITAYGEGLLDPDDAGIATLRANMPTQRFRLLSLRQAIEKVLGSALVSGTYKIDASKRLVTWDTAPGLETAPFDIMVGTPGAGERSPEDLEIDGGSTDLYNAVWVRGATAAGSGWFTDEDSITQWGRREKYVDAPDSDLAWKAFNVGMATLADTAQPTYHGRFTATSPDDGWRSRQRILVTSPMHDLAAEPFDTTSVTTRYLSGDGQRRYDIAFGSPPMSFTAKHGKEARRDETGPGSGGGGFGGGGYIPGGPSGGPTSGCCEPCGGANLNVPGSDEGGFPVARYGHAYGSRVFGAGDGSTTTFSLPTSFDVAAVGFAVAGLVTTPASVDAAAQTVTFAAAPATDAELVYWTAEVPCLTDFEMLSCEGAEIVTPSYALLTLNGPGSADPPNPEGYVYALGDHLESVKAHNFSPTQGNYLVQTRTIGTYDLPEGTTHVRIRGTIQGLSSFSVGSGSHTGPDTCEVSWRLALTSWDHITHDPADGWNPTGDVIASGVLTVPIDQDEGPADQDIDLVVPASEGTFQLHFTNLSSAGMNVLAGIPPDFIVETFVDDGSGHLDTSSNAWALLSPGAGETAFRVDALIGCT